MPSAECWKEVDYTFQRQETTQPFRNVHDDLRDAMLAITNDGDFQSCALSHGILTVRKQMRAGATIKTTERLFLLDAFKSVNDMVRLDWEGPYDD